MNASMWSALKDSFWETWSEGRLPLVVATIGIFGVGLITSIAVVALTLTYALALVGESGVGALLLHPAVTHLAVGALAGWGGWAVGVAVTHRHTAERWRKVMGEIGTRYLRYNGACVVSDRATILVRAQADHPAHAQARAARVVKDAIREVLGEYMQYAALCARQEQSLDTLDSEAEKKAQEIAWAVAGADVIAPAGETSP